MRIRRTNLATRCAQRLLNNELYVAYQPYYRRFGRVIRNILLAPKYKAKEIAIKAGHRKNC